MHVLFAHGNYPAQFRFLAPRLAAEDGYTCTFVTNNTKTPDLPGVRRVFYRPSTGATAAVPKPLQSFHNAFGHAHGVYRTLKGRPDIKPDLVVAHCGFGSSLFLPYLYDAPIINFFEYFYRPVGQDVGYRPEIPVTETTLLRAQVHNAMPLLDLDNCDRGWSPNEYQRGLFPAEYHPKISVIPEGVDTELYRRRPDGGLGLPDGYEPPPGAKVVTYVSRGFEMMRGFDIFMKAAKRICQEMSDVVFVVVGSDRVCYGGDKLYIGEQSLREHVLKSGDYDLSRFHFTGHVPEDTLARILSFSDLHVYLTVPFVTSWSLLDAMSCSCVVLASDQACVRDYITHGRNGLLCDFFDHERLASMAMEVLKDPAAHQPLRTAARRTIEEQYSLDVCVPRIKRFFEETATTKRSPSVLAEKLVRPGTVWAAPKDESDGLGLGAPRPRPALFDAPVRRAAPARVGAKGKGGGAGKTVLITWELGGGLGHMMQVLPLAEQLVRRGHKVLVALRQLERAASVFGRSGVAFLQAPAWSAAESAQRIRKLETFTQLLANVGFGDAGELFARACAWRNLFKLVKPDLVVFDHSPTALLASRSRRVARVLIGSGFCVPPSSPADRGDAEAPTPWALLRPSADDAARQRLLEFEDTVLARANRILGHWKEPPMQWLGQLYGEAEETLLTTFPELEQYPSRQTGAGVRYWGPVLNPDGGAAPQWPEGKGKRVFAYLKGHGGLSGLLALLKARRCPTVVYLDGGPEAMHAVQGFESPTLRFEPRRLDMARVARECDVALLHAGQGATAALLQAGKPILQIPLVLEQRLTAIATERLGASVTGPAAPDKFEELERKLEALLTEPRYAEAAGRFGEKYAAFDPAEQAGRMVERVEELLAEAPARGRAGRKVFAG
jgi:glycosyltransferase involved in cell wall biosynthesis/UDP:flavonoid glycosyltransferase YjiC (YdhE family)